MELIHQQIVPASPHHLAASVMVSNDLLYQKLPKYLGKLQVSLPCFSLLPLYV